MFRVFLKLKTKEEYRRILSNFASLFVLRFANYLLPLITFPYLVRVLGVEKFGLISLAQALIVYFQLITDYGFNLTATREISIYRDDNRKVSEIFSSVLLIKIILMIISFLAMVIVVFAIPKFRSDSIVYYLTFGVIIGQVLFPVWFFQGMEQMRFITYLNLVAKFLFTFLVFIVVRKPSDYVCVPLLNALGSVVSGVLSLLVVFKKFGVSFSFPPMERIKRDLKEGWHVFLSTIGVNFYRNMNTVILGIVAENTAVGYFSISYKLLAAIQSLQGPIGQALFPYISSKLKSNSNKEVLLYVKRTIAKYAIMAYGALLAIAVLFSKQLIALVAGNLVPRSFSDFLIMSPVILIGGLNYVLGILGLVASKHDKYFTIGTTFSGLINICLATILSVKLKDLGTSVSLLVSESALLLYIVAMIQRITKEKS